MVVLRKLSDAIYFVEKILVSIVLCILLVSVFIGFFARYILNVPLVWTTEVSLYSLVWLSFLGGSMSIKSQQAVAVSILTDKLRGLALKVTVSLGLLLALIFLFLLSYFCIQWILSPSITFQRSESLQLPMIIPYSSVVAGILCMTVHTILLFFECLFERK